MTNREEAQRVLRKLRRLRLDATAHPLKSADIWLVQIKAPWAWRVNANSPIVKDTQAWLDEVMTPEIEHEMARLLIEERHRVGLNRDCKLED